MSDEPLEQDYPFRYLLKYTAHIRTKYEHPAEEIARSFTVAQWGRTVVSTMDGWLTDFKIDAERVDLDERIFNIQLNKKQLELAIMAIQQAIFHTQLSGMGIAESGVDICCVENADYGLALQYLLQGLQEASELDG